SQVHQPGQAQPSVSIADREHFKVHARADAPLLFISDPIKGRISQQWTIQFTRGLWHDGQFQGVLVLAVSAEHLTTALKAIFPDPTDAASLLKNDGTYLARSYYLTDILGQKLPSSWPFIAHPEQTHGSFDIMAAIDEYERFYSWRRVENYPLVVMVGMGAEKARALIDESIRASHWQSGAGTVLLLLAGLSMSALWAQRSARAVVLQKVAEALAVETSRLNTVLEYFPDGLLIKDSSEHVIFVNALWPRLLGLDTPPSVLQGMHDRQVRELLGPERAAWLPLPQLGHAVGLRSSYEVSAGQGRHLEVSHIEILQDHQYFGAVWLLRDITGRKQHELELTELASTDMLTGLPNRRSFMLGMKKLHETALLDKNITGVAMMLDIDHFKRVNDTHGHATGDVVLRHVAKLIKASVRATDIPGRYGGEEFWILQPDTSIADGMATAQRIRQAMEASCFEVDGQEICVTISIGVSPMNADISPDRALQQADLALYEAKHTGRNRVCLWQEPEPPPA
ncbi:MAG: diguanylate cyclase, partial [Alcaligenaceae bacterium]|nr:diguanylate cyclase [Alcaligenaceae bacterium]